MNRYFKQISFYKLIELTRGEFETTLDGNNYRSQNETKKKKTKT